MKNRYRRQAQGERKHHRRHNEAGFDTVPVEIDLSSRDSILSMTDTARQYGNITIKRTGISPLELRR